MSYQTRRQFVVSTAGAGLALAQAPASLLRRVWNAKWIASPGAPDTGYGVYHFRRTFELAALPQRFPIHVTADNRYELFVNGRRVSWGPARGDLFHWRFETVDIARYLTVGKNLVAALVWNFGELAAQAQITLRAGLLVEGDTAAERIAGTGVQWKVLRSEAYSPLEFTSDQMRGYYAVGPGDHVDARKHSWGWEQRDFDDLGWPQAVVIEDGAGREASNPHTRWMLVEREIPAMEETPQRLRSVRKVVGIAQPAAFPARPEALRIPARSHVELLLDQEHLTTAYPELMVSGGKDATVRMAYAEALLVPRTATMRGLNKGNRNEIEGKEFVGNYDEFVLDGGNGRKFRPLWWRTYRYLKLEVETGAEALTIDDLSATYVGYPFERRAKFDCGSTEITRILDTGWRTARLCAYETYMDCPYYEQLQYVGDTRIQGLISLYNSGDARLLRNAIEQIGDSRQADGCTMSRFPTRLEQYIPGFALWWIGMVHDYWWYVDDPGFARRMLPGVRDVLAFFGTLQKENGSLERLPWWRFMDWATEWNRGDPPEEDNGSSAPFDLLLLMAYRWAAELEESLGIAAMAGEYRRRERQMRSAAQALYWDAAKRLYADTPRKAQFSQHTNTLAVLGDVIQGTEARDLMLRILAEPGLVQTSLYFRFYVHGALLKVGEGDRYTELLGDWRQMLASGLTTFAEIVDRPTGASRSDCHAWSASPNIEMLRTVLGVDSAAAGFKKVSVRPHLGKLGFATGAVPHPRGLIEVRIEPKGAEWAVDIRLPAELTGEFEWRGVRRPLAGGANEFRVRG